MGHALIMVNATYRGLTEGRSRLESGRHRPNVQTLERLGAAFGERLILGFEDDDGVREMVAAT